MLNETIKTHAHTTQDGMLNLSVNVGLADVDVAVVVQVMRLVPGGEVDENGWPKDFFERVAGSMPELHRALQHSVTLVTHNTREFSRISKLKLEDWEA